MATTFQLDIVTPSKVEWSGMVNMVIVPGTAGEFGILPGHAAIVSSIETGMITVKIEGREKEVHIATRGGFTEVLDNKMVVLAETAELPEEIDVERAERALRRAEERLANHGTHNIDYIRAEAALKRALLRLRLSKERLM